MLKKGTVKTNSAGYAVIDGDFGSINLNLQDTRRVLDGDEVLFDTKVDGTIAFLKVTKRLAEVYVGKAEYKQGNWVLLPDHPCMTPIYIKGVSYLVPGVIVAVRIDQSHLTIPAYAKLERVIGARTEPTFIAEYALAKYDLDSVFDYKPLQWVKKTQFAPPAESTSHVDLTEDHFVTIDGPDTKDFDDAIYIKKEASGEFRLKVAISDVSFYIKEGSDVDECAYQRGTSVYFADKVTPMLPPELANGLLSLRPGETKLAVVCEILADDAGKVKKFQFYRARIISKKRLTYTLAQQYLEDPSSIAEDYCEKTQDVLSVLNELYEKVSLNTTSLQELGDDFNVMVKKDDVGYYVSEDERITAHLLVECAMLIANECAAKQLVTVKKPFLRAQPEFTQEEYAQIEQWLGAPVPRDFSQLLEVLTAVNNKKGASILLKNLMEPAVYTAEAKKHFSLNKELYTHFTSPIRRYADLTVHRILLGEKMTRSLSEVAKKCTEQSKKAKYAEKFYMDSVKKMLIATTVEPSKVFNTTIIGQTEKSIKLKLAGQGLITFVNNKSLEEAGFVYNVTNKCWATLDLGFDFSLEYAGFFEDNFGYQLKFKVPGLT